MGRIFVCGDTHHDNDIAKIQPQNEEVDKILNTFIEKSLKYTFKEELEKDIYF